MQRNMRTTPQQAAEIVLYEMCQQLAESETEESEYETSDTLFADEREITFNSGGYFKITNQSSNVIEFPPFPIHQMTLRSPKRKVIRIFEGQCRLDLSRSSLE